MVPFRHFFGRVLDVMGFGWYGDDPYPTVTPITIHTDPDEAIITNPASPDFTGDCGCVLCLTLNMS